MRKRTWAILDALVLGTALLVSGCQPIERSARDAIAAAKGALDAYKVEYKCGTAGAEPVCATITSAVAVKDLAIDALLVYCAGPSFDAGTGPCQPSPEPDKKKVAAIKLNAVVTQLNQIMKDVNAIRRKP